MTTMAFALAAYLIGSIPFAVVSSRLFGLADPRSYGSGNPGATNVLRSGNKLAALVTLVGDAAKGAVAVWLAQRFGPGWGGDAATVAAAALAAFLGHLYPVFLGFKGGKGVATAAGVMLALSPAVGLGVLVLWIIVAAATRYSSLAALVAAVAAIPAFHLWGGRALVVTAAVTLMSALLVWRHRENIRRLIEGSEGRIGARKGSQAGADKV